MSLESILGKINEEKEIAKIDLDTISAKARVYKRGQVESAKAKLEGLYIDYKNEILKRAIFILVAGDDSSNFANIAEEKFKCFSVEGKVLFKEIVKELSPQLYLNKTMNAPIFDVISNVLEDKMKRLDVMSYNTLMFNTKYQRAVSNESQMVDLVTEAVSDIVGGEVVGLDALERVAESGVNKNYKSSIVPILIHSTDEDFLLDITESLRRLNPRVVRVVAGKVNKDINATITIEESNEENVGKALKKIATNA